jgi:hypothetical protein
MKEGFNNMKVQIIIFIASLISCILLMSSSGLFKFTAPISQAMTTKQQPPFIFLIFSFVVLILSGINIIRLNKKG